MAATFLKKAERRRLAWLALAILMPVAGGITGYLYQKSATGLALGVILGGIGSYVLIKVIYEQVAVLCPVCGANTMRENYARTPRGSDAGIEHHCNTCGSHFVDYVRVDNKAA